MEIKEVKYVFVTGGVVSGLGKGITAASLGRLLKARGYRVTVQKFDPYINIDPGMMSPLQHGEVFVTDDGLEGDLDLGHYERFIDENLSVNSNITTGKIYWNILKKERKGAFGGSTVQVVPHVTNEIKERIYRVGRSGDYDVVITEIGGTVGDIESLPFLEAIRQVAAEVGRHNVVFVHVTLVPYIWGSGELKSKPTQHSVKKLLSEGIQPQIVVCRSERELPEDARKKISLFCNIRPEDVIQNLTAPCLYEVPLWLEKEGLANSVCTHLRLENPTPDLNAWQEMVDRSKSATEKVRIALVGQYVELHDAYLSLSEALTHAAISNHVQLEVKWINSNDLAPDDLSVFEDCKAIVAEGSFGEDSLEGYMLAAHYARTNNIPYLGICQGMHGAAVDLARNELGISDANSTEFQEDCTPVIEKIAEVENLDVFINPFTSRKGLYPSKLAAGSLLEQIYQDDLIFERHHCMYEMCTRYRKKFEGVGVLFSAVSPDEKLLEGFELPDRRWFVGVQFDPHYKSRPNRPHPLFVSFIRAAMN